MLQAGRSMVRNPIRLINIFNLNLSAALGLGIYSNSNRNEYQKQGKIFLWSGARPTLKADNVTNICEPNV
jgi:hypothetical protein